MDTCCRFNETAIVSILKNRQGDNSDKNNYRPIAIVIALSKIFELCIIEDDRSTFGY